MSFAVPVSSIARKSSAAPSAAPSSFIGDAGGLLRPGKQAAAAQRRGALLLDRRTTKRAGWIPRDLWRPCVANELSLTLPAPLPPLWDDESGSERVRAVQAVLRSAACHQLESEVSANLLATGARRGPGVGDVEALVSHQFKEWSAALSHLCRAVFESPATHPYFLAVSRQQHDAVFYFSAAVVSVTAAYHPYLSSLRELCGGVGLRCSWNGDCCLSVACGRHGVLAAAEVLLGAQPALLGTKLPLLLSPGAFSGSVCRVPSVRVFTDASSYFDAPTHHAKVTGARILPHVVADLFRACSALGEFELDVAPNAASFVAAAAVPHPTAWAPEGLEDTRRGFAPMCLFEGLSERGGGGGGGGGGGEDDEGSD
eukprot:Rhum_TRINITY_DN10823_c0_g1::Rhum_TRINITY_DN10823_c0_g1_i1::g.40647::m.40647